MPVLRNRIAMARPARSRSLNLKQQPHSCNRELFSSYSRVVRQLFILFDLHGLPLTATVHEGSLSAGADEETRTTFYPRACPRINFVGSLCRKLCRNPPLFLQNSTKFATKVADKEPRMVVLGQALS